MCSKLFLCINRMGRLTSFIYFFRVNHSLRRLISHVICLFKYTGSIPLVIIGVGFTVSGEFAM